MLLILSGRSFIKIQYSSFPLFPVACPFRIATQLQYYVKREKCKVNDVIFPSGCEARAINLGNKNVKIGILTGGTSVKSKNIFTDNSRYPTGKHEINKLYFLSHHKDIFNDSITCPLLVDCSRQATLILPLETTYSFCGDCRARIACTCVQPDLALHFPQLYH